jgi:hypothetical protein
MDRASVRCLDHGRAELVGSSRPRQTTKTVIVSWRDRLEIIMPKPGSSALESLSAVERAGTLTALLQAHPELLAEAELLAAGFLSQEDRHAVAEDVAYELRALHLSQLADRAGPQWGGGYVDPNEAADEMLDEVVQPYLEDLERRARTGAVQAAREIAFGVLLGLYACRDEDDNDRVLTHAGTPDAVDNLGSQAIRAMKNAGLDVPDDWLVEQCPAWAG